MRIQQIIFLMFFVGLSACAPAVHAIPIDICSPEEIENILMDNQQTRQTFFSYANKIMQDQAGYSFSALLDHVLNQFESSSAITRIPFSKGPEEFRFYEQSPWITLKDYHDTEQFVFSSSKIKVGHLTTKSGKEFTLGLGFRAEIEQDQAVYTEGRSQKPYRILGSNQCEMFFRTFLTIFIYDSFSRPAGRVVHSDSFVVQESNTIESLTNLRYKLTVNRELRSAFERFSVPDIRLHASPEKGIQEIAEMNQ